MLAMKAGTEDRFGEHYRPAHIALDLAIALGGSLDLTPAWALLRAASLYGSLRGWPGGAH